MTFDELTLFLLEKLRLSHVYQLTPILWQAPSLLSILSFATKLLLFVIICKYLGLLTGVPKLFLLQAFFFLHSTYLWRTLYIEKY
jgi:hypothetical protein